MQSLLALPRHSSAGVLGEPHLTGNDSCRQEAFCGVKTAVLQGDRQARVLRGEIFITLFDAAECSAGNITGSPWVAPAA